MIRSNNNIYIIKGTKVPSFEVRTNEYEEVIISNIINV